MLFSCNRAFHHQLEKQLLIFNACNKCEHIHVDLEYRKRPARDHLAAIAMHLGFCPFHPSYWRWKVQTVDPVNMGAKQKDALLLQQGFPPPIGETTIDFQRMQQVRTHTCWSWISETACERSSGSHWSHCDASWLMPIPPFILKMEGPDCGSCHHRCKAKRCSSLATGFPPPIGETTIDFQRMQQVRTHTCWSWISETAWKSSSGCHCDASLLLPFPPFILKMEGPDCRSCQHGCKAKRCSSLATGLSTTNWRNNYRNAVNKVRFSWHVLACGTGTTREGGGTTRGGITRGASCNSQSLALMLSLSLEQSQNRCVKATDLGWFGRLTFQMH